MLERSLSCWLARFMRTYAYVHKPSRTPMRLGGFEWTPPQHMGLLIHITTKKFGSYDTSHSIQHIHARKYMFVCAWKCKIQPTPLMIVNVMLSYDVKYAYILSLTHIITNVFIIVNPNTSLVTYMLTVSFHHNPLGIYVVSCTHNRKKVELNT